jgi:phage tail-like protein
VSDPYNNFKFRLKWERKYIAGVSKCSSFESNTAAVKVDHADDANSPRKSSGRAQYEAITLESGVTQDAEFENWARKLCGVTAESSLMNYRKDILLEIYNEAGQLALTYKIFRCWVSEYQAQAVLDANANAVAIQHLKLEHEGWERL